MPSLVGHRCGAPVSAGISACTLAAMPSAEPPGGVPGSVSHRGGRPARARRWRCSDAYHYMTAQFSSTRGRCCISVEWGELRRVLRDGTRMAERNGHHLWAQAFRFQTAWLLTHAGDFARARALCEQGAAARRGSPAGENPGLRSSSGVADARIEPVRQKPSAHSRRSPAGWRADLVLMDWILNMPLRLGLGAVLAARADSSGAPAKR